MTAVRIVPGRETAIWGDVVERIAEDVEVAKIRSDVGIG
jgi:hypothetical protein